jgi:hypothetical protein
MSAQPIGDNGYSLLPNATMWPMPTCQMIKQSGFAPSELNREQPTLATAVQLWPTPRAGKTTDENEDNWIKRHEAGKVTTPPLALAVKMWPTPAACNPQDGEELETWLARRELIKAQKKNGNGMGTPFAIAVQMWPTPAARDWRDNGTEPAAQDRKSPNIAAIVMRVSHPDQINRSSIGRSRARLNPRWVAQLMGFPADWLDGVEEPSKG